MKLGIFNVYVKFLRLKQRAFLFFFFFDSTPTRSNNFVLSCEVIVNREQRPPVDVLRNTSEKRVDVQGLICDVFFLISLMRKNDQNHNYYFLSLEFNKLS